MLLETRRSPRWKTQLNDSRVRISQLLPPPPALAQPDPRSHTVMMTHQKGKSDEKR